MADRILVMGGYGVFGGKLTRRLARHTGLDIIVAGRSGEKAGAHCAAHGGRPAVIDREGDIASAIAALKPHIVIDAAGPFQAYGDDPYRVARAAIACGAHYLDLADDAAFVAGIVALDRQACAAGVAVLSGASSIPAISATALDELVAGLASVSLAGSAILPGNRAPRGLSVVRSIVGQAGKPLRQWRGGRWAQLAAWSDIRRFDLAIDGVAPLKSRIGSSIGAPDLTLFPARYAARSVLFHAGLDLTIMHRGLWLLALPVRAGIVGSIGPLARPLKWIADRLEAFGSDRGGMLVYAIGREGNGMAVERRWTLIAEAGDGPEIPPTPALLLALRLCHDGDLAPGARPATGDLTLAEIEAGLKSFRIAAARSEKPAPPLMERTLAAEFATMPAAWRRLADIHDVDHFEGTASVQRGTSAASRLVGRLFGFPAATEAIPIRVEKCRTASGERWTRRFGDRAFVSHLSRSEDDPAGCLREPFGPFTFVLDLRCENGSVLWPVKAWRFLGIPMPRWLMPRSETVEYVGPDGRFRFDVGISVPLAGLIVRYRGWLVPTGED